MMTEQPASHADIFTPLEVAKDEIWRRWNNVELRGAVEAYLKKDLPPPRITNGSVSNILAMDSNTLL